VTNNLVLHPCDSRNYLLQGILQQNIVVHTYCINEILLHFIQMVVIIKRLLVLMYCKAMDALGSIYRQRYNSCLLSVINTVQRLMVLLFHYYSISMPLFVLLYSLCCYKPQHVMDGFLHLLCYRPVTYIS
jgi:hypothetical protein